MTAIRVEQRDAIAVIRLDDGKVNALTTTLLTELDQALDEASSAGAVVLLGRPGRFSAGFDLKVMQRGPVEARSLVTQGAELLLRLYELPLPLVVGCTGHAVAGGALMLATGDWRIGALGDFKIGLSEVSLGMQVPVFAHVLATDRLQPRARVASVLFSQLSDPETAHHAGWLDETASPDEVEAKALEKATALAALPKNAYGQTKRSLRQQSVAHVRNTMTADLDAILPGSR